jgi:hypothetical protein
LDGFPEAVARLIDQHQDRTLWRLILALPKLGGVVVGLGVLIANWQESEAWLELPPVAQGSKSALEKSVEVAKSLQSLAVTKKVFDQLKLINEDILGVYRFGDREGPRVEVFWMAHALFAGAFGLRIEDLVAVTLAHELAHAYTHIGRDIDGEAWQEPGFGASALEVVEGLAQFYTAIVTQKLFSRAPGAFPAYEKLLAHQSGPYLAHQQWLQNAPNLLSLARQECSHSKPKFMERKWGMRGGQGGHDGHENTAKICLHFYGGGLYLALCAKIVTFYKTPKDKQL